MFQRDLHLQRRWQALLAELEKIVAKKPKDLNGVKPKDLNGVLFLIGMQELGRGPGRFTKEEK